MEKRVLLAIFLCFLSLYLWNVVRGEACPEASDADGAEYGNSNRINTFQCSHAGHAGRCRDLRPKRWRRFLHQPNAPLVGDIEERDVRVETRDVIAVFTNRGARAQELAPEALLDSARQPQELIVDLATQPLPLHTARRRRPGDNHAQ